MTSGPGHANLEIACAFVDELAFRGVRNAVVCPGSRSTPLAVPFASHPDVRVWVHVDERSAAYFALGMARQLAEPVAMLSTSGTAAANFLPAIVEARLSRIPLIALTADRPPELRGWGAAQTIDQNRLYADHVKWFADMPVPVDDDDVFRQARAAAARAVQTASRQPAGPVHLNLPFREPLLPPDLRPPLHLQGLFERERAVESSARTAQSRLVPDEAAIEELSALVEQETRGIIVCGPGESSGLGAAVTALAAASGFPNLADPLSGTRFGGRDRSHLIDAYDPFLRDQVTASALAPDVVIRVGAIPTSKPLQHFLLAHPGRHHILIDAGDPRDPFHLASRHIQADPVATLSAVAERLCRSQTNRDLNWAGAWTAADRAARLAIDRALSADREPFEGRAVAEVAAVLPDGATLVVGNSMPIRDVDAFVRGDQRRLRVVGNRGANGIDGVVSSALGAAAVAKGPVVLIVGDLSFYHDLNGLLAAQRFDLDATIVVLNNDGGGIFSFLPQAEQLDTETFETLFGTPIGLDINAAAQLYGAAYARSADWATFRRNVCRAINEPGLSVVELVTDRETNVTRHRAVWTAVTAALHAVASVGV